MDQQEAEDLVEEIVDTTAFMAGAGWHIEYGRDPQRMVVIPLGFTVARFSSREGFLAWKQAIKDLCEGD